MSKVNNTPSAEVIDIEEYAKARKEVPPGREYRIRIDKDHYVVKESVLNGKQILALAGKTPEEYHLYQHLHAGETKIIKPGTKVDLTEPGVERFTTIKIQNQEG